MKSIVMLLGLLFVLVACSGASETAVPDTDVNEVVGDGTVAELDDIDEMLSDLDNLEEELSFDELESLDEELVFE